MRRFYLGRGGRLPPPPPGPPPPAPHTHKQIQLLHPLRTHTLQFGEGDTMILSYSIPRRRMRAHDAYAIVFGLPQASRNKQGAWPPAPDLLQRTTTHEVRFMKSSYNS